MSKPDGGPAFPHVTHTRTEAGDLGISHTQTEGAEEGMTLREYAVIHFGSGLLAGGFGMQPTGTHEADVHCSEVLNAATMLADLMLQERDR